MLEHILEEIQYLNSRLSIKLLYFSFNVNLSFLLIIFIQLLDRSLPLHQNDPKFLNRLCFNFAIRYYTVLKQAQNEITEHILWKHRSKNLVFVLPMTSIFLLAYQIRISACFTWTDNSYLFHVISPRTG